MTPQELFDAHLSLAAAVAARLFVQHRRIISPVVQREDLEAAALVGLWVAAGKWDQAKATAPPRVFLGETIRQHCVDYLRSTCKVLRRGLAIRPRLMLPAAISDGRHEAARANEPAALAVEVALRRVTAKGRMLLWRHYAEEIPQRQLAAELGVHKSRVSQLISEAMAEARGGHGD